MIADLAYRHVQGFKAVWLTVPVMTAVTAAQLLGSPATDKLAGLAVAVAMTLCIPLLLGRLVIEVRGRALAWSYGYVGWPRWQVPIDHIRSLQETRTKASQGAGIRGPKADRIYNASLGGPALRVAMDDGRIVTLGSPEPGRLASFVQARMPRRR